MDDYIKINIERINERIETASKKAGAGAKNITLIAVSKTVEAEKINKAVALGIQNLGENRISEYLQKKIAVKGKIFWHLIGQMQTNKVKYIDGGISLLQSLDRLSLTQELQRQCEKKGTDIEALIEINIAREESKAGIYIERLDSFIEQLAAHKKINIKGLMTIAPLTEDKAVLRKCFETMRLQFERLKKYENENFQMRYLSMGMSNDFEEAILEGSNMVRIGSAIFGRRSKK